MRLGRLVLVLGVALAASGCKTADRTEPDTAVSQVAQAPAPPPSVEPVPVEPSASAEPALAEGVAQAADSIVGEEVSYAGGNTQFTGYRAYDSKLSGQRPGVLVVHEWWGHNDYARSRARMLAKLGYTALAVDMYGDGKQAAHPSDAKKFAGEVMSNMEGAVARFQAAQKVLEQHASTNPEQTAAIGYCFGGGIVLNMARSGLDLDGVASFHGSLATKSPAKKGRVKARVLVLHGEADPFVPPDQVEAFKKEMAEAGVSMKFVAYPGAKHAFTNPAATANGEKFGLPLAYDQVADEKSWKELEGFLAELFAQ